MDIIPIDNQLDRFYNHLSYNERVLFSAKFGDGKTFFLNEFSEKYQEEFFFITIHPVNYQVEGNKDIFELIKRDILFQLCKKNIISDNIDVETIVKETFNKESILDLADFLTDLVGIAIPGASLINKLSKRFLETKIKYDENKKTINQLFSKFNNTPGIYENDCYTQLITSAIKNHKLNNKVKKIVLIIEDLDRMDPAHVFRILNIFSAHIDRYYYEQNENTYRNKFCFDKIITVCHYKNIENFFHYIYGKDTDFNGYINKFISHEPFEYSFHDTRTDYIYNTLSKICDFNFRKIETTKIDTNSTFNIKILLLSTRKFFDLINNIDKQIMNQKHKVIYQKFIYIVNDFTKFIMILQRLQIDESIIIADLIDKEQKIDLIKFIGVNWLIVNPDNQLFSIASKTKRRGFRIFTKNEGNIITSVDFEDLTPQQSYRIDDELLKKSVIRIIEVLKGYIKP